MTRPSFESLLKVAQHVRSFPRYEQGYSASPLEVLGGALFGDRFVPRPRSGEDMVDAMERMKHSRNLIPLKGEALLGNPIVQKITQGLGISNKPVTKTIGTAIANLANLEPASPVLGGNPARAAETMYRMQNDPSLRGMFKESASRWGDIPKHVQELIKKRNAGSWKAGKELSAMASRGGQKAGQGRALKNLINKGEEIVRRPSDYSVQPNLPGIK